MRRFTHFAALDWSGARGERQRGIALAVASGAAAPALVRPGHVWSRAEILGWLNGVAAAREDMLIGVDFFGPSLLPTAAPIFRAGRRARPISPNSGRSSNG
jgi:hypothetical protein